MIGVRVPETLRERIVALVGPQGMAAFTREAIEAELARRERVARGEDYPAE